MNDFQLDHSREYDRLLVIIGDRLSALIKKGVVTERYYNPGNLFREVHILMTNDDCADPALVQPMVGDATLHLHNCPGGRNWFLKTLGLRRALLKPVVAQVLGLASEIKPQLIRCHGGYFNAYLAWEIHRAHGTPFAVSLHVCPEESFNIWLANSTARLNVHGLFLGNEALRDAQAVLPVYESIVGYLLRHGIDKFEVAYNVINPSNICIKKDYALGTPVRIICIGRQIWAKNPRNIIKAVAALPDAHLTLVGDGDLHADLQKLAQLTGKSDRFTFIPSIPNDDLCRMLPGFDLLAYHSDYPELSKVVIEGALTGLPMVVNRRKGEEVPELKRGICVLVEDTESGYGDAIAWLIQDSDARERLGREARNHANAHWSPAAAENNYVRIYRKILAAAPSSIPR